MCPSAPEDSWSSSPADSSEAWLRFLEWLPRFSSPCTFQKSLPPLLCRRGKKRDRKSTERGNKERESAARRCYCTSPRFLFFFSLLLPLLLLPPLVQLANLFWVLSSSCLLSSLYLLDVNYPSVLLTYTEACLLSVWAHSLLLLLCVSHPE